MEKPEADALARRRERTRTSKPQRIAEAALAQSVSLAARGHMSAAERAVRLAERQLKVAAQSFNLAQELKRLAATRQLAETALIARATALPSKPASAFPFARRRDVLEDLRREALKDPAADWVANDPRGQALLAMKPRENGEE